MTKLKQKRNRGVILTPEGLSKLQEARVQLEYQENFGDRYTYEKISELTYLDLNTIKKILVGKEGVDKRSLEKCFLAFKLKLTEGDFTKPNLNKRQDWNEAVSVEHFFGRTSELATLENWLLKDRCRLIAIIGMGGIGKTTLSIKCAEQIEGKFDCVVWKSLRDAPPVEEILANLIEFISEGQETKVNLPERVGERITRLIDYFRSLRCLVLLDNAESVMDSGNRVGKYRYGYEGYGELFRRVAETNHLSCLMLTTREKPKEVAILAGEKLTVRSLQLKGLSKAEGQEIIKVKGLSGSELELNLLSDRYAGNPLALKVVATTIQDLFDGNIAQFLSQENTVFGDVRDILDQQFERLSDLEKKILYWLAIAREPVSLAQLQEDFVLQVSPIKLLEAFESLWRRSLIEKNTAGFTQQPVVMEYVTSRLIEGVCEEIVINKPRLMLDHALIKATAKDYIRENQIRLILQPIIHELLAVFRNKGDIETQLTEILVTLRGKSSLEQGYTAGNIINLFCQMETDLTGYDFSLLCVWQADLRQARLHQVNFQSADLSKSVFAENFGGIWSVAFSPDGQYLAAGDTKGDIILRRITDGQPILSFKGHHSWVVSLAFSPDGNTLASGSCDCTAKLWDVNTGECLHTLDEHEQEVWSVAFGPDGTILASGCDDHQTRLWSVSTGKCLKVFQGHLGEVLSVAFSLDGQMLISGSHDNTIKLWDINTQKCKQVFQGHEDGVRSVSLSPDGQMLASSSNDRTVRLWDLNTGECLKIFRGHANAVFAVTFCPQGNLLASSSIGQKVRLWNIETGECLKVFRGHSNVVNSVTFNPQGNILASGSYDQTVKLWDINTYQCFKTWQGYSNQALSVTFSLDGQTLVSGGHDQRIRLWDINTGKVVKTLHDHTNWVFSVAFSPLGKNKEILASGSADKTVKLWDLSTGKVIKTLYGHEAAIRSIAFSPFTSKKGSEGWLLASGSEDRTIRLWDVNNGQILKTLRGHQAEIWSIAFNLDGQILASASFDKTVKLWDIYTGECLTTLNGHESWVWSIAFSPDNKSLATTSADQTIRFWNVASGECQRIWRRDEIGNSQLVAFSPNGQIIASCNQDHKIRLWQLNTEKCFKALAGHTALINSIAFSPDGHTLVSSSEDETIKLWDLKSGECLKTLKSKNPYEEMNIQGVTGLSKLAIETLKILGATNSEFEIT
ncbi:WD-40 repeat-containing protein [Stanieria cyanosphaera PCC 7437]|uniref:WD-40 repeat-containing protein n=1 Tax=Stanieria cyanosphaera (strain ATCC 29371 / PCC 7437) TaxID=111780 RepID=K9XUL7_STAC7|nr:WD40 repeat domain-containing protein [Stanieria cyanosphaera]AFZ35362.1 WD-40 repeat-containing protein [Stanieria cyanosphaera PCC 7437]